ncbi:MAG: TolB-like 6-bladed beta-propeller domain-containing protein [Gemmatimonadetes bacterium]|nr:TolB-like 6-bladed beta-propeller domain-containing protein [Gemmatimonadota bacterium]
MRIVLVAPLVAWIFASTSIEAQSVRQMALLAPQRTIGSPGELVKPRRVLASTDLVVVVDESSTQALLVYSRSRGSLLRRTGIVGGATTELLAPGSLVLDSDAPNSFWVHDVGQMRMVRMSFGAPTATAPIRTTTRSLPATLPVFSLVATPQQEFLATGILANTRLVRIDTSGRVVQALVDLPGKQDDPTTVRQEAYRSTATSNSRLQKLALATRHADRLEIFTFGGQRVAIAPRPANFEPTYTIGRGRNSPVMATGPDLRFGYIDVSSSSERIVALYSGLTRRAGKGVAALGHELHVIDWNGATLRRYRLPRPALALSVAPAGDEVYVLHPAPAPAVSVYRVP